MNIIQLSSSFISKNNFTTLDHLISINSLIFTKNLRIKPQKHLRDWDFIFRKNNIISILKRDQLSMPSTFQLQKNAATNYIKLAHSVFQKKFSKVTLDDFSRLEEDEIKIVYPNFYTCYYLLNNQFLREDIFFRIVAPNSIFYIGEVFEYNLLD